MKHDARWVLALKLLLLSLFVVTTNNGAWQRLRDFTSLSSTGVFIALWSLSAAAMLCVAFLPHRPARWLWTVVFFWCGLLGLSHSLITRSHLELADVELLLNEVAFADQVIEFYAGPLLLAALAGVIGIVALNMPPFWHPGRMAKPAWLLAVSMLPLVPLTATASVLYVRGGQGGGGLPVQFTSAAFAVVLGVERLFYGPPPERKEVAIAPLGERRLKSVAVIMDESVRGDLLDINRPDAAYSGLLPHAGTMANFGVMSSIANCSAPTNAGFRYGVGRRSHLADLATNPAIWEYAKRAGYRTVYVDGQRHHGGLMNLMNARELEHIDQHIQLAPATPPAERDIEIARRVRRILESDEPVFVYVNKMGAHFPYEGKYPPERAPFQPVLARTYFGNEIDPKNIWWPKNEDAETRTRVRNSYLNTLAWNVGGFFDVLLPGLDLSNAVVVYMADHGQYLNEDGKPGGMRTHCSTVGAAPVEGMVPLVVLTHEPATLEHMRSAALRNYDRVSQFSVFPTVLALLGYLPEDIARAASSEPPLDAALSPRDQQFLSRFFVRLGRQPVWSPIERTQ